MTIRRVPTLALAAALSTLLVGCGGTPDQSSEQFQSGLEEAAKAAERGRELQKGKGGVPPVPDPEAEG